MIRILLAEDQAMVRGALGALLKLERDIELLGAAADGLQALEDCRKLRPDIVVTDIEMPGMTGIELAARLLALRPAIRIVMMTGDPERAEAARGHPSIVDEVLLKPCRSADLVEAVRPAAGRTPVA
jgi:two-component system, NarL family, response regulator DesR